MKTTELKLMKTTELKALLKGQVILDVERDERDNDCLAFKSSQDMTLTFESGLSIALAADTWDYNDSVGLSITITLPFTEEEIKAKVNNLLAQCGKQHLLDLLKEVE